ncbi:hypothetical protein C2845_PM05G14600 [Panicum miliaceum]|uniref:Uncharacterized protein n=1 Tax=Panicum miliaceum TaxID=4540 RepID=A0A3L6SYB5_PANMI|nr:hypothetical protein C2845_PM05G14600 [Panicum miliaceum]
MEQVDELLELIEALKLMGVTGASVVYSFIMCRIQPLQKRDQFGFKYLDEDLTDPDDDVPLADLLKKSGEGAAHDVSGGSSLPPHPKGQQMATRKRRATVITSDDTDDAGNLPPPPKQMKKGGKSSGDAAA